MHYVVEHHTGALFASDEKARPECTCSPIISPRSFPTFYVSVSKFSFFYRFSFFLPFHSFSNEYSEFLFTRISYLGVDASSVSVFTCIKVVDSRFQHYGAIGVWAINV